MQLLNKHKNKVISNNLMIADNTWSRGKGLIGTKNLLNDQALWIKPCRGIHTFFMKFSISVLYLDKNLKVIRIDKNFKPWRIGPIILHAKSVIEFSNEFNFENKVELGDQLDVIS